jgi:hypothetical protein
VIRTVKCENTKCEEEFQGCGPRILTLYADSCILLKRRRESLTFIRER